jgi:endoglucanase
MGLKGGRAAMFGVDPDVIISLDADLAGDNPMVEEGEATPLLGNGPVIVIKDPAYIIHKKVKKMLIETAKRSKIPYQLAVVTGGTSEATVALLTREGKPGAMVGIPVRYMHSTVETADVKDVEDAIKLVAKSVENASKYF